LIEHYKDGNNPSRGLNKLFFRQKGPYKVITHDIDIIKVQNLIDDKFEYFHINLVSPYRFDSNRILPADVYVLNTKDNIQDSVVYCYMECS
jgi:hypothetical protein